MLLLVLVSAGLHALAFPPWDWSGVAWVALVPFFVALYDVGRWRAFALGVLWGVAAHWAEALWVLPAMAFYYQQPWWFAGLFGIGSSLVFRGLHYGLFAAVTCSLVRGWRGPLRAVLVAVMWVAFEFLRARGPTGDPWLLLGYALVPHPTLLQTADLGGVYLLSFVVVVVNAAVAEVAVAAADPAARVQGTGRAWAVSLSSLIVAGVVVAGTYAYGSWCLAAPLPREPAVPITIVQGNNDLGSQWHQEHYGEGLQTYLDLSRAAALRGHPQVLIWPENAVTFFLAREPRFLAPIRRMLADTGAALITGAPHYQDTDPARPAFFNSAFYLTAEGIAARYDKVRLLPFAEYFPLHFVEFLQRRFDRVRTFTPGDGAQLLETRLGRVAIVICFEAVFPELVRERMREGADILVNLSNDAWLGHGSGPAQHVAMVVPRAVENRTWVVRATATGISAVIDPYGVVHDATPTFVQAVVDSAVVPMRVPTVYKSWGDWFAWACVLICAALAVARRRWRRRESCRAADGEDGSSTDAVAVGSR